MECLANIKKSKMASLVKPSTVCTLTVQTSEKPDLSLPLKKKKKITQRKYIRLANIKITQQTRMMISLQHTAYSTSLKGAKGANLFGHD